MQNIATISCKETIQGIGNVIYGRTLASYLPTEGESACSGAYGYRVACVFV